MKFSMILFFALTYSCAPQQQEALGQQPKSQGQEPASTKLATFTGRYAGWFEEVPKSRSDGETYGVISVDAIDQKAGIISLSTLVLGKSTFHRYSYKMDNGILKVNSAEANFQLSDTLFSVAKIGIYQQPINNIVKLKPFTYTMSKTINRNFLVTLWKNITFRRMRNASTVLLRSEDIENFSPADLKIMRLGIYARHGASLYDRDMTNFFSASDWYAPIFTMDEAAIYLTKIEVENIEVIETLERKEIFKNGFRRMDPADRNITFN